MQVVVSVIHREGPRGEDGAVYVIDWATKEVVHRFSPPPSVIDEFPEVGGGGVRGYRGICFANGLCYIASADSLYGYDASWELQHTVTHPFFSDVHEIAWDGSSFWVTSTGVDALLQISPESTLLSEVWLGELDEETRGQLGIPGRVVDRDVDHRRILHPMREEHVAHPNGVQIIDGRPFITLYNRGAVVAINPVEVVWADLDYYGSHSGRLQGDRLHLAASFKQSLLTVDLTEGEQKLVSVYGSVAETRSTARKLLQDAAIWVDARSSFARSLASRAPSWLNPKPQANRPGWTRGLCVIDDRKVLLGSSPASVYEIDTVSGSIESHVALSDRIQHAVFAVEIDPRSA